MQSTDKYMSRKQLWDQLYSDMQSRGVIESLRTQMRNKLLQNLALVKAESSVIKLVNVDVADQLAIQTIHALIVDHLRLCGFEFSLSLFLPESGMASVENARRSLRANLGKRAGEVLDGRLDDTAENSLLLKFFEPMTRHFEQQKTRSERLIDADVQTDREETTGEELDDNAKCDGEGSFQRRFFLLKKSVEERKRMEIDSEMQRFKEGEYKTAELEWARKLEGEREKLRVEFEEKYNQRNAHLDAKEREMEKQLKRKAEETERELSNQRNVLIDELQRSKIKDDNLRTRESDLERRGEEAEKRLSNLREILDQREKLIKNRESEFDDKVRTEVRRVLSTAEEEREDRLRLLRKEEERVKELREELQKKKKGQESREEEEEATLLKLKHLSSQYKVEKESREELEEEVAKMRKKMEAVESLENLQMQNDALRRDLEDALLTERDIREQLEAERSTLRDMKLHLTSCSPEIIVNLKREAESLQNLVERQNANHKREMEENGQRAQDLKSVNRQMRDAVQSKTEEMEGLHRIVEDLQLQLRYSQEALRIIKLTGQCESSERRDFADSSPEEASESTPKSTPSSRRRSDRATRAPVEDSQNLTMANNLLRQSQQPTSSGDNQVRFSDHLDHENVNRVRLHDLIGQAEELHSTFRRIADKPAEISRATRRGASGQNRTETGQRRESDVRQFLENLRPSGRTTMSVSPRKFESNRETPNQPPADDRSIDALVNARLSAILGSRQSGDNDNFTSTPARDGLPTSIRRDSRSLRRVEDDASLSKISKQSSREAQRADHVPSPSVERNLNLSDYEKERSLREERSEERNRDSEVDTDVEDVGVMREAAPFDEHADECGKGGDERERDEYGTLMEQHLEGTTLNESSLPTQQQQQQHSPRRTSMDLNHSEREIRANEPNSAASVDNRLRREVDRAIETINESLDLSKWRPLEESTMTMRNETLTGANEDDSRIRVEAREGNVRVEHSLEESIPADDTIQEFNRIPKFDPPKLLSQSSSDSPTHGQSCEDRNRPLSSAPREANGSAPLGLPKETATVKDDSESSYSGGEGNGGDLAARSSGLISRPPLIRDETFSRSGPSSSSHSRSPPDGRKNERTSPTSPRSVNPDNKDSDGGMDLELMKYVEDARKERGEKIVEGNLDSDISLGDTSSGEFKHDLSKGSDADW